MSNQEQQELTPGQRFSNLNGHQRDLLRILIEVEMANGPDLISMYQIFKGRPINKSSFYPNLDVLEEEGYLRKGKEDSRTNTYSITEAGRKAARDYARLRIKADHGFSKAE